MNTIELHPNGMEPKCGGINLGFSKFDVFDDLFVVNYQAQTVVSQLERLPRGDPKVICSMPIYQGEGSSSSLSSWKQ